MKSRRQLYLLILATTLVTACSTTPQYVMKPDYDYINKVESSSKFSAQPARIYWVNPPMKREKAKDHVQD